MSGDMGLHKIPSLSCPSPSSEFEKGSSELGLGHVKNKELCNTPTPDPRLV